MVEQSRETPAAHRSGEPVETKLLRIAAKARQERKLKFINLYYLMNEELLLKSFRRLSEDKAAGIDKVTSTPILSEREWPSEEPCALIAHARFWEGQGPTSERLKCCGTAGKPGGQRRTQSSTCAPEETCLLARFGLTRWHPKIRLASMARKPRVEVEGGLYHVITRGNNRQAIFNCDDDYQKIRRFCFTPIAWCPITFICWSSGSQMRLAASSIEGWRERTKGLRFCDSILPLQNPER